MYPYPMTNVGQGKYTRAKGNTYIELFITDCTNTVWISSSVNNLFYRSIQIILNAYLKCFKGFFFLFFFNNTYE